MLDQNLLLISLFVFALALGWLIARFPPKQLWSKFKHRSWHQSYHRGLHFLLNDQADNAIESLIRGWEVNQENFDLHNALANMLRRKGEVDRAITIHTNLLTASKSSNFTPYQLRLATTELACDYIKAGLLDRAERLLINVINNSKDTEETALELLLQVYQLEKEWDKAIAVAAQLFPHDRLSVNQETLFTGKRSKETAHFFCEKAVANLLEDDFVRAEQAIQGALLQDENCARATLLKAELYFERGEHKAALEILERLPEQDASLLVEALPLLNNYLQHRPELNCQLLTEWQQYYPSAALEKALFDVSHTQYPIQASLQFEKQVRQRPTLRGLDYFIDAQAKYDIQASEKTSSRDNIELVHRLVKDVLKNKQTHRCKSCGFSGNQLHWQCPQCQQWDTIRRLRGPEGD